MLTASGSYKQHCMRAFNGDYMGIVVAVTSNSDILNDAQWKLLLFFLYTHHACMCITIKAPLCVQ